MVSRRSRRRLRRLLFAGAVVALALPTWAAANVALRDVDTNGFPTVRAAVVTDRPTFTEPVLSEGGTPVAGLRAENLGRAKSVVLAVDQSKSMGGKPMEEAIAAARSFVAGKPQGDRVSIVSFGVDAIQLSNFSTATIDADSALRTLGVETKTGTALYDAVVVGSNALARESLVSRVLVLVSDGADFGSSASAEAAIAAARSASVAVYPVAIEGPKFSAEPLERLARETGGKYFGAATPAALRKTYATLADELRRTWLLEYVTTARPGERLPLEVEVSGQGSATSVLAVPSSFGRGAVEDKKPSGLLPESLYTSSWGPWAFGGIVGLLILAAGGLFLTVPAGTWLRRRLAAHTGTATPRIPKEKGPGMTAAVSAVYRVTEQTFGRRRSWLRLQHLIQTSGVPLHTVELVYISTAAGALVALIVAVVGAPLLAVVVGFAVGALGPLAFVALKAKQRIRAFDQQLPDLLLTLAASLKAGHSFRQGIQAVVDDGQPPASIEFQRVLTETRLGRSMDSALIAMAERVGSKDLDYVVTAAAIQREVGGGLADLFDMVAETVRNRQQFRRKVRGLTAMGRLSAYILIALPFVVAATITALNSEYMAPLYDTSAGTTLIVIGISLMAVGSVLLRKIVSFRG